MSIIFPYIGNFIIPTDFHIFQRGRYTTNQLGVVDSLLLETSSSQMPVTSGDSPTWVACHKKELHG